MTSYLCNFITSYICWLMTSYVWLHDVIHMTYWRQYVWLYDVILWIHDVIHFTSWRLTSDFVTLFMPLTSWRDISTTSWRHTSMTQWFSVATALCWKINIYGRWIFEKTVDAHIYYRYKWKEVYSTFPSTIWQRLQE